MPDTSKRVRITTEHPGVGKGPVVLVDGKMVPGVTRIQFDHTYSKGISEATITLIGVDIDLEAAPQYLVKVVGPKPND